jgi:peroxiredoxin
MTTVRDTIDQYREAGVTVWGVTAVAPLIIGAWAREHHFGVPILSDYERGVSEAYVGLYDPEKERALALLTKRGVVAVGRDGIVRHVWAARDYANVPLEEDAAKAIAAVT